MWPASTMTRIELAITTCHPAIDAARIDDDSIAHALTFVPEVAELAGLEGHARQTGYAMHALPPNSDVPWHRVINARGEVSPRSSADSHELQRLLLEEEGIEFDLRGRCDLKVYRWKSRARDARLRP